MHKAKLDPSVHPESQCLMGANSTKIEGAYKVSNLGSSKHESRSEYSPADYDLESQVFRTSLDPNIAPRTIIREPGAVHESRSEM